MEMYIKNPNKKVSYSFRIKPETLEDLKLYATATNKTVPEIINQLITDKLDGVTLTNDYLNHYKEQLITIPDIQRIYDNTNTVETLETMDLLRLPKHSTRGYRVCISSRVIKSKPFERRQSRNPAIT